MRNELGYLIGFELATEAVERARGLSRGAAQKLLDEAVAAGLLHSEPRDFDADGNPASGPDISSVDLEAWLNPPPTNPGGKQARIIAQLSKLYPDGVPDRDLVPRTPLQADLLAADRSLAPLDLKTLQRAIEAFNATRKR